MKTHQLLLKKTSTEEKKMARATQDVESGKNPQDKWLSMPSFL